jgi:hypothetical protein
VSCYFGVPIVRAEDPRPLWPRVIPSPRGRRPRQQLKVDDGLGTVTHRGADTVVPSITSTDDDDVFILRVDVAAFFEFSIKERLGVELRRLYYKGSVTVLHDGNRTPYLEEFHCEVDAVGFAVGDLEVPRPGSASTDDDGIIFRPKLLCIDVGAHMRIGHEGLGNTVSCEQ